MWAEAAFDYDFVGTRILAQHVFVCNTPETVQYVFNTRNAVFERKSFVMRRMLGPLARDGLIISDGEIWRKRRKLVSPIIHASNLSVFAPVMAGTARETAERWAKLPEGARARCFVGDGAAHRRDHLPGDLRPGARSGAGRRDRRRLHRVPALGDPGRPAVVARPARVVAALSPPVGVPLDGADPPRARRHHRHSAQAARPGSARPSSASCSPPATRRPANR